ncbi:MAG: hypothetical protein WBE26_08855 [Phycisphaerae bacterium]
MKRTYVHFGLAALLVMCWIQNATIAQVDDTAADDQRDQAVDDATAAGDKPGRDQVDVDEGESQASDRQARKRGAFATRRIAQLKKLQEAMNKKLDLSKEQEQTIDQLFSEHLRKLEEGQGRRSAFAGSPKDAEELKVLRDKLIEARKAGDQETLHKIRKQFREKLREDFAAKKRTAPDIIEKLAAELDENQRSEFHKLVQRLWTGESHHPRPDGLRKLWRAVMKPDMGLSEEQQRAIRETLRGGFASIAEAGKDKKKVREITNQVRADIFKELTPEQRAKIEATLADDDKDSDRRRDRPDNNADDRETEKKQQEGD